MSEDFYVIMTIIICVAIYNIVRLILNHKKEGKKRSG
jgi:hypothetical protein